jgi:DNA-directed RNA polymerase specialized sigma24 family protein
MDDATRSHSCKRGLDGCIAGRDRVGFADFDTAKVWLSCRKRVKHWRIPPRWSLADWDEEVEAEASAAALQAERDFDPGRRVPWEAFVRQRIMSAILTRYRREWGFAGRRADMGAHDLSSIPSKEGRGLNEDDFTLILRAVHHLSTSDLRIIEGIYWEGHSESVLAGEMGVSQQAVSKRKRSILRALREIIIALEKDHDRL